MLETTSLLYISAMLKYKEWNGGTEDTESNSNTQYNWEQQFPKSAFGFSNGLWR